MRFLVVEPGPEFSVQDVCVGWVEGLRANGQTVVQLPYAAHLNFYEAALEALMPEAPTRSTIMLASKQIEVALFEVWPDWLVIITGMSIPIAVMQLARARGIKVALVCTESPYQDDSQIIYAKHADMCLVNDPINLERYRQYNPNTHYMPHGYSKQRIADASAYKDFFADFTFVGSGFPSRMSFFEQVRWPEGLTVKLAGYWGALNDDSSLRQYLDHPIERCCDNSETLNRYKSATVSANLYRTESEREGLSQGWACGPREIELAQCGTFFLRDSRGESDELFGDSLPLIDRDNFGEQVGFWADQARAQERTERISAAQDATRNRSFSDLMLRFLELTIKQ